MQYCKQQGSHAISRHCIWFKRDLRCKCKSGKRVRISCTIGGISHNHPARFFPNSVSLGSSAIVKVPEQVGAAKSARRKVGNRVPRKRFPSKVSKQGSQEVRFPRGSQEQPKQGFPARGSPGTGSQARFPSKVPRKRSPARFPSKVPRQGYQEQIPKQGFPARGSQAGFPGRGYQGGSSQARFRM